MSEQNKALARRVIEELDRQCGPVEEFYTPDSATYMQGNPAIDLKTYKRFSAAFFEAFPDLVHGVDDIIAEGDRVALRITVTATHRGTFMDIPATGRRVSYPSVVIFRFVGGKVAETRAVFDQMGLLQQIGAERLPTRVEG